VYNDGGVLLGIPYKTGSEFSRVKGRVLYKGTTEELKNLVRLGAVVERIESVLHYPRRREESNLWGESIEEWESIKREGVETDNKGKRAFGKLGNNSAYGKFGLKWDKYNMTSSDNTNLTIGCFIASYARMETMSILEDIYEKKATVYYVDTDSFHINKELPAERVNKAELAKLKYEGSYDVSYYLGRKQYYLSNSETGEKKIGVKGYNKVLLKEEDWKYASEGGKKTVKYWEFKKENYEEIIKVDREKEFSSSLKGRRYLPEGNSEALEISHILGFTAEKRIRASLANTELDTPEIRVLGRANSKAPLRKGWIEGREDMSIESMLSATNMYNYSIKTGELLGKDIHLVVIDIDLKEKISQSIADRLLSLFKGYYTVKTPSDGYHIYLKVRSEEKFKSQHLLTLIRERTTIEIIGEKKKIMAPGSVIGDKMYTKIRGLGWNNSLSREVMERVDFISKLSEAGLVISSDYVESETSEAIIVVEKERGKLIDVVLESFKRKVSIKFVSLVLGSSQGKPNTALFENGNVYCFRCGIVVSAGEYISYSKNSQTDSKKSCKEIKNCKLGGINEVSSLEQIDLNIERGESAIIKARAGSGKTSYMIGKAMESSKPILFLAPFVKDCEVISGMCPTISRQFGKSETRSQETCSNVMVMTYNSFAFKRYGIKVREWMEKVKKEGLLVVDEVDMMMDERFNGCQETYSRLYRKGERWSVMGLSATPEKIYKSMMRDAKVRIYELKEREKSERHIKIIKVKNTTGEMAGFVGQNRVREIVDNLKSRLPYKEGHVLMFMDSGEITKEDFITNCIFSEGNENIDAKKLLRSVGHEIRVKSKNEGVEITQCSVVGSRTYSLNLEGFDNHTNVYIGNYNSDVPEQHFRRLRSHQTTGDNPDYMFITYKMSGKVLGRYRKKLKLLLEVYKSKKLKIPERYREEVKSCLLMKIDGAELSIDRISREIEEQEKVKYDEEIKGKIVRIKEIIEDRDNMGDNKMIVSEGGVGNPLATLDKGNRYSVLRAYNSGVSNEFLEKNKSILLGAGN
jgi:hypothetical protein